MCRSRLVLTLIIALSSVAMGLAVVSANREAKPVRASGPIPIPTFRNTPQGQPASPPRLDGCVTCHAQIEPMHKYGTTETLDTLKDGKDAVGITCTGCHGG